MIETLSKQGVNKDTVICSKCFTHMLKNEKIHTVKGGVRHKLSNQGSISKFVHTYIAKGYAKESIDTVLQQHARLSKASSYQKQQKKQQASTPSKKRKVTMTAKLVTQMQKLGWTPPQAPEEQIEDVEEPDVEAEAYARQWNDQYGNARVVFQDDTVAPSHAKYDHKQSAWTAFPYTTLTCHDDIYRNLPHDQYINQESAVDTGATCQLGGGESTLPHKRGRVPHESWRLSRGQCRIW